MFMICWWFRFCDLSLSFGFQNNTFDDLLLFMLSVDFVERFLTCFCFEEQQLRVPSVASRSTPDTERESSSSIPR